VALIFACVFWVVRLFIPAGEEPVNRSFAPPFRDVGGGVALLFHAVPDYARFNLAAVTPHSWLAFSYLVSIGSPRWYSTMCG